MHSFWHHLKNPGQIVGPYALKAPSQPVRGFDAPQRDALYIPLGASAPVNGSGHICGSYRTQSPAFFNAVPVAIIADVSGAGGSAGTPKRAGGLIDLSALSAFLKGA